jgi:hypothetical protein
MMNEPLTTNTLGEFAAAVKKLRRHWELKSHQELWFRGEARDYKNTILRPELYRPAEGAALKPIPELLDIENELHEEFKRNAVEYADRVDDEWEWDSYFLMQHHSGPTRLLDWSDGALIALHFALRNTKYELEEREDHQQDARVYVLEAHRYSEKLNSTLNAKNAASEWKKYVDDNPNEDLDRDSWEDLYLPNFGSDREEIDLPLSPLAFDMAHITRRIAAQRGRFIIFGKDPNWLANEFKGPDSLIRVIVIPHRFRGFIRQELRDCGVTESVIYPDLDGVGRETRQLWEDRRRHAKGPSCDGDEQ